MSAQEKLSKPREAILEVATHLFGEKGYAGTTMRDIASAVGVLPGSLYAHIDGKETLLTEIVDVGFDRFLSTAAEVASASEPADVRLRTAIKEHVKAVADSRERTMVVLHQWRYLTGAKYDAVVEKRRDYQRSFERIVDDGVESGLFRPDLDRQVAVFAVLGALNWVPEWFSPEGPASAEEVGERLADSLLSGFMGDGASGKRVKRRRR
jgi:TetR/AcrR family transcriptional regulator, cholesterol catabolism regulator